MDTIAEVDPAGTVNVAGGMTYPDEVESETTVPPDGAGPLSVTVAVVGFPPMTVAGLRPKPVKLAEEMVRLPEAWEPFA